MTRYISMDALRKSISPDVTVVDADAARPPIALAPAELAALGMTGAGVALEQAHAGMVSQSIVLPVPPSANDYWSWSEVGVYVTKEARLYKKDVQKAAQWCGFKPFAGDVAVYVHVFRPAKRGDLDNYHKVLLDALKGVAYADDNQVVEIHAYRHDDKMNPRVEVEVRKVPA